MSNKDNHIQQFTIFTSDGSSNTIYRHISYVDRHGVTITDVNDLQEIINILDNITHAGSVTLGFIDEQGMIRRLMIREQFIVKLETVVGTDDDFLHAKAMR